MYQESLKIEKRALLVSAMLAFVLAIWGIGMAVYTGSDAIMMDGAFNLLSAFLAVVGLAVSGMMAKGPTAKHPYGFYAYETLTVLIKGLFILGLILLAITSNLRILFSGGRTPLLIPMIVYASPALILCLSAWISLATASKRAKSDLLRAESSAWMINTLITAMIELALIVVLLLRDTPAGWIARYIDQILVIILCVLSIGDPIKLIFGSLAELMMCAAGKDHMQPMKQALTEAATELEGHSFKVTDLFVAKIGRKSFVRLLIKPIQTHTSLEEYCQFVRKASDLAVQVYQNVELYCVVDDSISS